MDKLNAEHMPVTKTTFFSISLYQLLTNIFRIVFIQFFFQILKTFP